MVDQMNRDPSKHLPSLHAVYDEAFLSICFRNLSIPLAPQRCGILWIMNEKTNGCLRYPFIPGISFAGRQDFKRHKQIKGRHFLFSTSWLLISWLPHGHHGDSISLALSISLPPLSPYLDFCAFASSISLLTPQSTALYLSTPQSTSLDLPLSFSFSLPLFSHIPLTSLSTYLSLCCVTPTACP